MLQIPKHSALREELVHRQHQELKLLSSVSGCAQRQDPHHCQVRCLVHLPKQHLKWAAFCGTQHLCLAAHAFSSSCKFFQRTVLITLSSPILKEIRAHKSRINKFLALWDTSIQAMLWLLRLRIPRSEWMGLCLLQHQSLHPLQEAAVLGISTAQWL